MLGDHMKDFYIRRGQSVKEHRIIDEGPGKHPDGVGPLSEHKEAASLAKRRSIGCCRLAGRKFVGSRPVTASEGAFGVSCAYFVVPPIASSIWLNLP